MTSAVLTEKLNSVGTLLTHEIDPARETSVVGRFLNSLRQLLDAKRSDSIQGAFKAALVNATKENGTLAVAVKNVVSESVKPLAEQVEKLTREIRDQQVTQQVLSQTTAKGITYEELVVVDLQNWSKLSGAEVVTESGYWIATTHPFLIIAIRFLVIQQRLNKLRTFQSELDVIAVEQQIQQIRTALGRIRTMKKSLTEVGKSVAVIKAEADAMSTDIQSALKLIEQTLSVATTEG
ncbi:hypothetical protein [Nostoc sp.]|uniref:hypothetical protein n=1 Tax=Nostoc sp. TaxID=1180 RepID=UPI002FF72ECD